MLRPILSLGICLTIALLPGVLKADGMPKAVLLEKTFDFGQVYAKDSPLTHDFIIKNSGEADLRILSVVPG